MTKEEFSHSSSDTQANLELSEIAQLTDNGFPACGATPTPSVPTPGATRTPSVPLPCSRYRYSMSTTETRTFRSRHSRCCMGTAAVLGSLLTIGVFLGIMIHFTVIDVLWKDGNVHPKLPIPRADTALGKSVPDFLGSVKIINTDWDYNLAVSDSLEYRDLAVRVEQELDRVFLLSPLKDIYNFSLVRTFRRGSIVAVFETILTEHRPLSAEKVKSAMTQGLEHRKYIRGPDDVLEIKQVVLDADSIQIIAITTTTVHEEPTTHLLAEMEESTTLPTTVIKTSTPRQTTSTARTTITKTTRTTVKPTTSQTPQPPDVNHNAFTETLTSTIRHTTNAYTKSEDYAPIDPEVSTIASPVPSSKWTPWRGTHFTTGPYFWTPGSTPGHGYHHTSTERSGWKFVTRNHGKAKNVAGQLSPDVSTLIPGLQKGVHLSKERPMQGRATSKLTTLTPLYPTDSWQSHARDVDLTSWFVSSHSSKDISTQAATTRSNRVTFENFDTDKLIDTIPGLTRVNSGKTESSNPKYPLEPVQPTLHPPDQFFEHTQSENQDHIITESNIPKQDLGFNTNIEQNQSGNVFKTQGEHDNRIHDLNTGVTVPSPGRDVHSRHDPSFPFESTVSKGITGDYDQSDVWHTESSPTFVQSQGIHPNHDNGFRSEIKPHQNTMIQNSTTSTKADTPHQVDVSEVLTNISTSQTTIKRQFTETNEQINQNISSQHDLGPNINQSAGLSDISTGDTVNPSHTPSYQDALFYPGNLSLTETEIEKETGVMGLYPEKHPNNKAHHHTGQRQNTAVIPDSGPDEDAKSRSESLHPHEDITSHIDGPDTNGDPRTHLDARPYHSNGHGFAVTEYTPSQTHTTWDISRNNLDNGGSTWMEGSEQDPLGAPVSPHPSDYNFPEDPDELYDYLQHLPNNAAGAVSNEAAAFPTAVDVDVSSDVVAFSNNTDVVSKDTKAVSSVTVAVSNDTDAVSSDADAVSSDADVVYSDADAVSSDADAVSNDAEAGTSDAVAVSSDAAALTNDAAAVSSDGGTPGSTLHPEMRSSLVEQPVNGVDHTGQVDHNAQEDLMNKSEHIQNTMNTVISSIETGNESNPTPAEYTPSQNISKDEDLQRVIRGESDTLSDSAVNSNNNTFLSQTFVSSNGPHLDKTTVVHFITPFSDNSDTGSTDQPPFTLESVKVTSTFVQPSAEILAQSSIFPSQAITSPEATTSAIIQESLPSPAEYKAKLKQNNNNTKDTNSNGPTDGSSKIVATQAKTSTISTDPVRPTKDEIKRAVTTTTPMLTKSSSTNVQTNKLSKVTTVPSISTLVISEDPISIHHEGLKISQTPVMHNMPTLPYSGSADLNMSSVPVTLAALVSKPRNISAGQEGKQTNDDMMKGKDNTIMQNDYYYNKSKSKNKKLKLQVGHESVRGKTLVRNEDRSNDDAGVELLSPSIGNEQFTQATQTYKQHQTDSMDSQQRPKISTTAKMNIFSSVEVIESSSAVTFPRVTQTHDFEGSSSTQEFNDLPVTSPDLASTTSSVRSIYLSTTHLADASIEVQRSATDFIDATSVDILMESSVFPTVPHTVAREKERELSNPYPAASGGNGGKAKLTTNACLDITVMTQFIPGCLTYFSQIMRTDDILEGCQHFLAGVMCVTDEYYKHSGQQCTETQVNAFIKQHARLFNNALPNFDPLQCVI